MISSAVAVELNGTHRRLKQTCTTSRDTAAKPTHRPRGSQFAQLIAFAAIARARSFTRAAQSLGLSAPTVSESISNLEAELGVRLLNRTTRSVSLTEAGQHLIDRLAPLLEGVESAIDSISQFRDSPVGMLRLSVHPLAAKMIIEPILSKFSAAYPKISLDVSVGSDVSDITRCAFDAGIQPAGSVEKDMIAASINVLDLVTVASPGYLAQRQAPSSPVGLRQHNCVRYIWQDAEPDRIWNFADRSEQVNVQVNGSFCVNSHDLALRAVLDGVGIGRIPVALSAPFVANGSLVGLLPGWSTPSREFLLFYSSRRHVPSKLRAFIEFLKKSRV